MKIDNHLFYCVNKDTYPPFKEGLYLEEFVINSTGDGNVYDCSGRLYIPVPWTNFQIEGWFGSQKQTMQNSLDQWIQQHPNEKGYFTVVQYDDGPLLKLPDNTQVYGACSGTVPIPLIYQDLSNKLEKVARKKFGEKSILCSFVGTITHHVRDRMINELQNSPGFQLSYTRSWTADVQSPQQVNFIETTVNSKFALAPRGYGRSSFRFFEIFKLGTIPIYIWDDIEWLPYKDVIDYNSICISVHANEIHKLPELLNSITEDRYNEMLSNYEKLRDKFELPYLVEYVCSK